MVTAKKKTETVVVTLRIKEALRRRLETAADHNEVSVNNEITRRLEDSFARAELATLTENVERLSALYEQTKASSELVRRFRQNAEKCIAIGHRISDSEGKLALFQLANTWLELAIQRGQSNEAALDLGLGPAAADETDEGRQARLRALSDDLLKHAKRNEARSADDLGAEPREWDTRSALPRSRSRQEQRRAERAAGEETLADRAREGRRASPRKIIER